MTCVKQISSKTMLNNTPGEKSTSSQQPVSKNTTGCTMEEFQKQRQLVEDQMDYKFIQRIIQELTQSCALPVPLPAASIPPLILQAAQYFWENYDQAIEERWYCIRNVDIQCLVYIRQLIHSIMEPWVISHLSV